MLLYKGNMAMNTVFEIDCTLIKLYSKYKNLSKSDLPCLLNDRDVVQCCQDQGVQGATLWCQPLYRKVAVRVVYDDRKALSPGPGHNQNRIHFTFPWLLVVPEDKKCTDRALFSPHCCMVCSKSCYCCWCCTTHNVRWSTDEQ